MSKDRAWEKIAQSSGLLKHDFSIVPFRLTADAIKDATRGFKETGLRESRILCKQDTRESRPAIFRENNLFLLPIKNGIYAILQGEGYVDIPAINQVQEIYHSKLNFKLETSDIGDSEMQHVDYAYASSLIRSFLQDDSLVLTIRGRKYTPRFTFKFAGQEITVESVQTEVDAGYEGRDKVVLIEAKNRKDTNVIIRQLYYPFRQWSSSTAKKVIPVFFARVGEEYHIWQFEFAELESYDSIRLVKAGRYRIR